LVAGLTNSSVLAAGNLVTNGDFSSVGTHTESYQVNASNLPNWAADVTGNPGGIGCLVYGGINNMCGTSYLGPGNVTATFAVFPGVSPNGGNFFAGDAADDRPTGGGVYQQAISQTINGLVVGAQYSLTFYQAGAQQAGFTGATTDKWQVTFGSQVRNSTIMSVPSGGVVAWNQQSMSFTATATSQVLSFLAIGTPNNAQPPFALLDGVRLIPEPASIALLGVGIIGVAGMRRRRACRRV